MNIKILPIIRYTSRYYIYLSICIIVIEGLSFFYNKFNLHFQKNPIISTIVLPDPFWLIVAGIYFLINIAIILHFLEKQSVTKFKAFLYSICCIIFIQSLINCSGGITASPFTALYASFLSAAIIIILDIRKIVIVCFIVFFSIFLNIFFQTNQLILVNHDFNSATYVVKWCFYLIFNLGGLVIFETKYNVVFPRSK